MTIIYRVGEGQSPSGKILDRGTKWFNINELQHAEEFALETRRTIYRSVNKRRYMPFMIPKRDPKTGYLYLCKCN